MKKVLFVLAVFVGIGGSATAQEASKSKKAPKARAEVGAKKSTAVAEAAVAETSAAEVVEIREIPVNDENGNQSGTKKVKLDKDGNKVNSQAARETEKARRMDAEASKSSKKY